jgi:nucleotide-binding universal stress UspA family protein
MVPMDFSPVAFRALEFLAFLRETAPIRPHLVHVIPVNTTEWEGSTEKSDTIDGVALKALEQKAIDKFSELQQQVGFPFTEQILYGGLTSSLARYATQQNMDLVIMGTAGADGWWEKISGSEAQHVVRYTEVPVITVHQYASITPLHNLLWVADFKAEKQPEQSVATIKRLQQLFGAKLHLLHIVDKEEEKHTDRITQAMAQFAERLGLQNVELHLHHNYKVAEGVRNFNQATDMDLVVVGTHARKGVSHLLYGSVAETLVNHCIRPLMSYHLE